MRVRHPMSKRTLLNLILFLIVIAIIYGIWAIQPLPFDDWSVKQNALFLRPVLPKTGQEIRYCFSGAHFLSTNPFSLFKAWSLLTAIVSTSLLWAAFIKEPILIRTGLTLLAALGFPYLGHIGPWNFAASVYTVSVIWMMVWYVVFKKIRYANTQFVLKGILFFVLTFIAASWHEAWLVTFAGIAVYFLFDAFFLLQKRDKSFKLRLFTIHLSVILAYILAVTFYARGGASRFIDVRLDSPGHFASLFNWPHMIKSFLLGTKEILVLLKDSFPVFLLILYIKLNKNFQTKLSSDFRLFIAVASGTILFMYVLEFIFGAPDWRVRWLCVFSLSVAFYALPKSILIDRFSLERRVLFEKTIRFCSIIVAVIWLSYNAYFTYGYTNIDVVGWLQYRQMVLDRNPDVLKRLCCRTLPKNRPKGVAIWDHEWGAEDNRYRFFMGPSEAAVYSTVKAIWNQSVKK